MEISSRRVIRIYYAIISGNNTAIEIFDSYSFKLMHSLTTHQTYIVSL